jgi:chorismate mutase/prephenate dehydratase
MPADPRDEDVDHRLADLRARIDEIDRQLVRLVNERAQVAVQIGELKRQAGGAMAPVYVPHRERAVLDQIRELNPGPLPATTLEAIWREIMSGSVRLQTPLRIAYLGPEGSFSHAAAAAKFGASVEYVTSGDIAGVFDAVARGHADHGLVPVENSAHGGIAETLDAFQTAAVSVCGEVLAAVHHHCMSRGAWDQVRTVASKPEVFSQCRRWLANVAPDKEIRPVASTSAAAAIAAEDPSIAALASRLASEIYDVPILFDHIEDRPDNITRFLVLGREPAGRTGDDKTAMLFVTGHQPGALAEVLQAFKAHGVNLTDIEKRPSGRSRWEYAFYVDAIGHLDDPRTQQAVTAARGHCLQLKVLGSYPRAADVL